ncbi:endochitinase-like [Nicotiana tomentosiformis]|uniref:endochitinase-like n=1 Tax=Nicotiana tomentosiformis TaxID=4098 RepID=UPI00051BB23C|nr:endochitinase-like [Nicotiana tomentosiformis]
MQNMNMMRMKLRHYCKFATLSLLALLLIIPRVLAAQCVQQASLRKPDITEIISSELFDKLLLHRNHNDCLAKGFYKYDAFVQVARNFTGFGTTGSITDRKREVAAFLAQTSHATTGGWPTAPDGPYTWGYCFKIQRGNPDSHCKPSVEWPCAPGKKYYGRGPIQISYNYNYGPCGDAIGENLLRNPDLVAADRVISFKTALWVWMTSTSKPPMPTCHDVILGKWKPSTSDTAANRLPGYGVITNILNGGLECGHGFDEKVKDRIGFYLRYCKILGVSPGENLDCGNQKPFGHFNSIYVE